MYESMSCGGPLCSLLDFQVTNLTIDHCVETHSLSLPCLSKMVSSQSHLHELFVLVCSSADFALPLQSSGRLYATFAGDDYHYYLLSVSPAACLQSVSEHWTSSWHYHFHLNASSPCQLSKMLVYFTIQVYSLIFRVCLKLCSLPNLLSFPLPENFPLNGHTILLLCFMQIQACYYHGHHHFPAHIYQYHSSSVPWWFAACELPQCHSMLSFQWQACSWRNR